MSLAHNESSGFKAWFVENLSEYAADIAGHGADQGYPHITYTKDCVVLYEKFEEEIWEMLVEDSESFGHSNPMEFVATFVRADMLDTPDTFKNLLLWYACERVTRELEDEDFNREEGSDEE